MIQLVCWRKWTKGAYSLNNRIIKLLNRKKVNNSNKWQSKM